MLINIPITALFDIILSKLQNQTKSFKSKLLKYIIFHVIWIITFKNAMQ